jgi:hypothetical protein
LSRLVPAEAAGRAGTSLERPPASATAAPKARDSFAAASNTIGNSARGLGGRIRIVGALTESTATTWPDASRTGAATVAAPATTSSVVSR